MKTEGDLSGVLLSASYISSTKIKVRKVNGDLTRKYSSRVRTTCLPTVRVSKRKSEGYLYSEV